MNFYRYFTLKFLLSNNNSFIWLSDKNIFKEINKIKSINIDLLIGIDNQKKTLLENTINFAKGNITNNALLWGSRGSGKSTLVKSIFNQISKEFNTLKLIQLNKNDIKDIVQIYTIIEKYQNYKFIVYIDDLSFESVDTNYKAIKSILDGSIQSQPENILLYITSNRRHLMPRDMIDNERSSAIHTDESVEEKISLSDRFGLWIGFHNLSQNDYLEIIKKYCDEFKLIFNENIKKEAVRWSMQRGNRTGRTAWQFI